MESAICYNLIITKDDGRTLVKKKIKKFIFNGLKVLLGIYLVYVLISQQPVLEAKKIQKMEMENSLAIAREIEVELRTDISMADSRYYIERAAMEKLGLLKPGDRVFIDIRK
ncbi:MAG: hypothetical protein R6W99_05160 [Clostridia bacterium]